VDQASLLLATTDLNADEIASRIGLSDARMLTLLFKRVTGITPSTYRLELQRK